MSEELKCGQPTGGTIGGSAPQEQAQGVQKEVKMTMVARVGKEAPDFTAPAFHNGKFEQIKLSDFRGHWLMLCFYPGDFTFVWPTELAAVASHYSELQALDVNVISLSTDSRFSHMVWNESELSQMVAGGIPWAMASDQAGRIGTVYGVYDEDGGVDIRGRFLIDPDGVIQAMEVMTPSVGRNIMELIRQVKAFQHVRATGEVMPAGWVPGEPTLKPGPALVGKVWKVWKPK